MGITVNTYSSRMSKLKYHRRNYASFSFQNIPWAAVVTKLN